MRVRLTQLDGKLPNLALMRLSAWHRSQGDEVFWEPRPVRQLHEPEYDRVYGSALFPMFDETVEAAEQLRRQFPGAIVGGYGGDKNLRVDQVPADQDGVPGPVPNDFSGLDYSGYPGFTASIGYAMRGCTWKCGFCPVPGLEGAARSAASVADIWRGEPFPRQLHLLDNDFFGNPNWREVVADIIEGDFEVCINQGINVRVITEEAAAAMAAMKCRDDGFEEQRIYTAWDNLGGEAAFFRGIDLLIGAGIKPRRIMAYMLVGYRPRETFEEVQYRHARMVERGILPYPMVHDRFRRERPDYWRKLRRFQSWAVTPASRKCRFEDFRPDHRPPRPEGQLFSALK